MCTEFNLKIDESTELLDTRIFDSYDTNELLLLSDTIKQSCFEFLFNSHIECCPYCGAFISLRLEKTVKEHNAINATIVNEGSLIVQII